MGWELQDTSIALLKPYPGNARTHSKKQIKQIARSIERFGFTNPVLVSDDGEIIAGHGRVEAAKLLGRKSVPTLALSHLSATERRAYVLADNKLALNAGWDKEILAIELQALITAILRSRTPASVWRRSTSRSTKRVKPIPQRRTQPRMLCRHLQISRSRSLASCGTWVATASYAAIPATPMRWIA